MERETEERWREGGREEEGMSKGGRWKEGGQRGWE